MQQRVVVEQLLPIADGSTRRDAGATAADGGLPLRAVAGAHLRRCCCRSYVEAQCLRALLESNAAFYAAQMTAMDAATRNSAEMIEQPDALHEQGPPGGDHARDHRSRLGRAGAVATRQSSSETSRVSDMATAVATAAKSARSSRSSDRSSTSSSRAGTCRRSTTPSASTRRGRRQRQIDVIAEVEQHLGENRVRTVAMKPTDGMQRGMTAIDTGRADLDAGRARDARPRAERARRAGGLPRPSGQVARSAGRFTARRRRSRSSRPS